MTTDSAGGKRLLHVGCGRKRLADLPAFFAAGWRETRLDVDPGAKPDILASITRLDGVADGAVDAIWSSHNLEHVFAHEARLAAREMRRVLAPGGFAIVTCPDLTLALRIGAERGLDARIYDSPAGPITVRDMLFGHQASIAAGAGFMAHRNGFDLVSLNALLSGAGFARVFGQRIRADLWFIATREAMSPEAARDLLFRVLGRAAPAPAQETAA